MGQTAEALRDDIEERRRAMTHDVNELEQRAKSVTDWRQQVNDRPMAAVGIAAVGGMILGFLTGGGSDSADKQEQRPQYAYGFQSQHYQPQHLGQHQQTQNGDDNAGMSGWVTGQRGPSQATQVGKDRAASKFDEIRGALMGLAATKAEEFLREALPGFSQEADRVQQQSHDTDDRDSRSRQMQRSDDATSSAPSTSTSSSQSSPRVQP